VRRPFPQESVVVEERILCYNYNVSLVIGSGTCCPIRWDFSEALSTANRLLREGTLLLFTPAVRCKRERRPFPQESVGG